MREQVASPTISRGWRWTGLGALAVMALMVLSPMASAVTPQVTFKNSSVSVSDSVTLFGCASGKAPRPGLSTSTGFGHGAMNGKAKECSLATGGGFVKSLFDGFGSVGLTQSVRLGAAASLINISWNVKAATSDSAIGVPAHCPFQNFSYAYPIYSGSTIVTWVYINETDQYCYAGAFWEFYGQPYVYDATTSTYTYASFQYAYNQTGNYHENFTYSVNFTNSSYSSNYSFTSLTNQSYGVSNTSAFQWAPSWYISGSWAKGDHLLIFTSMYLYAVAQVFAEKGGKAATSFNAAGTAGHVDLTGITIS